MRGFFAIGNPSGTRNACSQFSITVQNNFLSQEVQRCYWWTALQNFFGWQKPEMCCAVNSVDGVYEKTTGAD